MTFKDCALVSTFGCSKGFPQLVQNLILVSNVALQCLQVWAIYCQFKRLLFNG